MHINLKVPETKEKISHLYDCDLKKIIKAYFNDDLSYFEDDTPSQCYLLKHNKVVYCIKVHWLTLSDSKELYASIDPITLCNEVVKTDEAIQKENFELKNKLNSEMEKNHRLKASVQNSVERSLLLDIVAASNGRKL